MIIKRFLSLVILLVGFNANAAIELDDAPWGVAYDFKICLPDYSEPKDFQATITFAAGDAQIAQDDSAFVNVGTLPTHIEAGCWDQNLTAAEMQGDQIILYYVDSATKVFIDSQVTINTIGAKPFIYRDVAEAAGTPTTTELPSGANTNNDAYNNYQMSVIAGTGAGQSACIQDYVGSTTRQLIHETLEVSTSTDSVIVIEHTGCAIINISAGIAQCNAIQGESADWSDGVNAACDVAATDYDAATGTEIATVQSDLNDLTDGGILVATTIATLATQVSFTLTAGSTDDNTYNRKIAIITDASTATQKAVGKVLDYVGSTKAVTLTFDPGVFTMAATDNIVILSSEF